jgi:hypothetical protein
MRIATAPASVTAFWNCSMFDICDLLRIFWGFVVLKVRLCQKNLQTNSGIGQPFCPRAVTAEAREPTSARLR